MKRITLIALVLACSAGLAGAQMATDSHRGEVSFGVSQTDSDTTSSKFLEYRDIPNGLFAPYFRFAGEKNDLRYDFIGVNVRQRDLGFKGFFENGDFRLEGYYSQIPHNFGNDGKTLLQETSEGIWQLSDTMQRSYQTTLESVPRNTINFNFLNAMVSQSLAAPNRVDLRLTRERGNIALSYAPEPLDISVAYFRERRVGSRAASGTAFGFGNVVELPEPLHYLTQDFRANVALNREWGSLRAGIGYNTFEDRLTTMSWDNPFRVTDSTDASAYQAPGSQSINGPSYGLMALPPDNEALTGNVGVTFKFGKSRLIADASLGSWKQNQTPFIPYTTNTSIVGEDFQLRHFDPTVTSTLPVRQLDGQADVTSLNGYFSSRPTDKLFFNARFRSYDFDNKTGRVEFPGYVRYDAVWEEIPRISVPYSYKNQRFDATLGYDLDKLTLEVGFKDVHMDRSFRETEKTKENGFSLAADLRGADWIVLRAGVEFATRDYEHLEIELSEESSFIIHGTPTNLLAVPSSSVCPSGSVCNLRYDQAKKDSDRFSAQLNLTPGGGEVALIVGYLKTKDDYTESSFGLTKAEYDTWSGELNWTPNDKTNLYAFYSYEKIVDAQTGRQSGATVSVNPLDNWTSNVEDKVNSFGAGLDLTLKPEKWFLNVFGRYQKVDGHNDLSAPPGGVPSNNRNAFGGVQDIADYDDTKLAAVNAELRYQLSKAWEFTLGGFFEDYEIRDSNTSELRNYSPGSFFLAANDADYQAKVGYFRVTYRF